MIFPPSGTRPEWEYAYDRVGNLTESTDPLGNLTSYEYDTLYRLTERLDDELFDDQSNSLGRPQSEYAYDLVGNLHSLTDPEENTTTFLYDDLDRLHREQITLDGQLKERVYTYDPNGNLVGKVDRNGRETEYVYDELNRRTEEKWLNAQSTLVGQIGTFMDTAGQLLQAHDFTQGIYTNFTYDELGRVKTSINSGVTLTHEYDVSGNRTGLTSSVSGTQDFDNTYEYDALNRLTWLTQEKLGASGSAVNDKRIDFDYNLASQFHSLTRFDDLAGGALNEVATSAFDYDGIGRLTELTHTHDGSLLTDYDWTFDAASRIATQTIDRPGTTADEFSDYGYNQNDELTSADHTGVTLPDEQLEYDLNGNRTQGSYDAGEYNRLATDH